MRQKRQQLISCVAVFSFAGLFASCTSLHSTPSGLTGSDQSATQIESSPRYEFVKTEYDTHTPEFWGADECAECHADVYQSWIISKHARTMNSLTPEEQTIRNCLRCHATASQKTESGYLDGVQCEACHGLGCPEFAPRREPACAVCDLKVACFRCHTSKRSPGFNVDQALQYIRENQH